MYVACPAVVNRFQPRHDEVQQHGDVGEHVACRHQNQDDRQLVYDMDHVVLSFRVM